jgi:hypothetical protein
MLQSPFGNTQRHVSIRVWFALRKIGALYTMNALFEQRLIDATLRRCP